MSTFATTGASGWLAALLVLIAVCLPFLARAPLRVRLGLAPGTPRRIMTTHYAIGFAIFALACAHMWVSMSGGMARHTSAAGLYIATAALAVLLIQTMSGSTMRVGVVRPRTALRRFHFGTMLLVVALIGAHIALNGVPWLSLVAKSGAGP